MSQPQNPNNGTPPAPPDLPAGQPAGGMAPITTKLIVNLHADGNVSCSYPTDPKVLLYMLSKLFGLVAPQLRYEPPSPIVQPPPGFGRRLG